MDDRSARETRAFAQKWRTESRGVAACGERASKAEMDCMRNGLECDVDALRRHTLARRCQLAVARSQRHRRARARSRRGRDRDAIGGGWSLGGVRRACHDARVAMERGSGRGERGLAASSAHGRTHLGCLRCWWKKTTTGDRWTQVIDHQSIVE